MVCQDDIIGRLSKANKIKHDRFNPTAGPTTCHMVDGLAYVVAQECRTLSFDVTRDASAKGRYYYWDINFIYTSSNVKHKLIVDFMAFFIPYIPPYYNTCHNIEQKSILVQLNLYKNW